eukprot:4056266-Prymnesium_polylepis.1
MTAITGPTPLSGGVGASTVAASGRIQMRRIGDWGVLINHTQQETRRGCVRCVNTFSGTESVYGTTVRQNVCHHGSSTPLFARCEYVTGNGPYVGQRLHTRVDS